MIAGYPAAVAAMQRLACQTGAVRFRRFNSGQRAVIVIGLGVALYLLGQWLIGSWQGGSSGWVAYAPLSQATSPVRILHPWVRLLIWLALTAIWVIASLGILSTRNGSTSEGSASEALDSTT
jgi:uncharacterized membrane protein YwaF